MPAGLLERNISVIALAVSEMGRPREGRIPRAWDVHQGQGRQAIVSCVQGAYSGISKTGHSYLDSSQIVPMDKKH